MENRNDEDSQRIQKESIGAARELITQQDLDGVLLMRASSFAWATGGAASYINTASTTGEASLLVTQDRQVLFTNNIEAPRLGEEEELNGRGWELMVDPWYSGKGAFAEITSGLHLGADLPFPGTVDLSSEIARLRARFGPEEGERMRQLGMRCAHAMEAAIRGVQPGQSETQIAARLAEQTWQQGVQPIVNLIATDERISHYRHPLPAPEKKLERYAMLVLCGRWKGVVCSLTRLVHFGPLPDEIRKKSQALAEVDAAVITATTSGQTLGEIFARLVDAYAASGYPDEWKLHHQGGAAGYEPREYLGLPGATEQVELGQAFAWNPSITGTKSEDTILVRSQDNEVVTEIPDWPMIDTDAGVARPDILVIE